MYFRHYGTIDYSHRTMPHSGFDQKVQNILKSAHVQRIIIDDTFLYHYYIVEDGKRVEDVSFELYKKYDFYWTILVVNKIINPYVDWAMGQSELENYVKGKYKNIYGIHHFLDLRNNRIADEVDEKLYHELGPGNYPQYISPITNFEFERQRNLAKKEIVVVDPTYINRFVETYNNALKGNRLNNGI